MTKRKLDAGQSLDTMVGEGDTKTELRSHLNDTRDSIGQTVTEIKDTVAHKYESVKDAVGEAVDWREQFNQHPLAWSAGTLSLGALVGYYLAGNYQKIEAINRLQKEVARLGDRFIEELSDIGDHVVDGLSKVGDRLVDEMPNAARYVAPALAAAALPVVAGQIKDRTGVDLSGWLPGQDDDKPKGGSHKKKKKKDKKKKKRAAMANDGHHTGT